MTDIWYTEKYDDVLGLTFKIKDVLHCEQSDFQKVEVIETVAYGKMLLLDGLVMTTEKDEFFYHEMISHIPMLAHSNPERVLVVGGGDGGTVREVLKHPSVKEVVLCEIDKAVIDVSIKYLPSIAGKLNDSRVTMNIEDAVEYMKRQKNNFDVVLIDSTDPLGPGVGLFTEDFYTNVKNALKKDGVIALQSESPIMNKKELGLISELLKKVFPIVKTYVSPMPTYPGCFWSWTFCSESVNPLEIADDSRAEAIEKQAKLYNRDYHKSVFTLPTFMRDIVKQ
jgi:spermidine synthase